MTRLHRPGTFRHLVAWTWVLVPVVAAASAFGSVVDGHPAYPILLTACLLIGVALVVRARRPRPTPSGHRLVRTVRAAAVVAATGFMIATVVTSRPHPPHAAAIAAMTGTPAVRVTADSGRITLTPTAGVPRAGVIFQPGARTDARSYVPILTRLAERGYLVVVAKQPLSIAPLAQGRAVEAFDDHPEVTRWVAVGHSFGGVPARATGESGDPRVAGVVLWATYAHHGEAPRVPTLALYGTTDRLIAPDDARGEDGPHLRHVAIDGAVHTSFSDYGPAWGDGQETRPHERVQADIVDRTDEFVRSVTAPR